VVTLGIGSQLGVRPSVTIVQAEAQLNAIQAQVLKQISAARRNEFISTKLGAVVQPMQEAVVGDSKTALWLLMAAVLGLMLTACLNLASAQLGRALSRQREVAMRAALGAAKGRLIWNVLAENLILAAIGGVAGVLLAEAALHLFCSYSPVDLARLAEVGLSPTVLMFSIALTLGASVLCGLLPALRLLRTDPQMALQQNNGRAVGASHSWQVRNSLIGLQVFGGTALLLITGLFSRSLLFLLNEDRGFDTHNVMVAGARASATSFDTAPKRIAFDDGVLARLRAISRMESDGLVSAMPLEGETWIDSLKRVNRPDQRAPEINLRWVSPGYFETTRQTLTAGRFFEERDRNLNSIVLSESDSRALWGAESPIGGQVRTGGHSEITLTVIGVVADSRNASLKSAPVRTAYLHYPNLPPYRTYFFARGALPTTMLASSMREAIWTAPPDVTVARVQTMDSQVNDSLAAERFQTLVLAGFGFAALLIALLGIYGVLSYSVSVRLQEIGVRLALGASHGNVYRRTIFEAGIPVLLGLVAGLAASLAAARVIEKTSLWRSNDG